MVAAVRDDVRQIPVPWLDRLRDRAAADERGAGAAGRAGRADRRRAAAQHRGREPAGAAGDPRAALRRAAGRARAAGGPAAARDRRRERVRGRGRCAAGGHAARAAGRVRRGHPPARPGRPGPRAARAVADQPRARRGGEDRHAGRGRARVPAPADALDRLPPARRSATAAARTRRWPRRPRAPSARGTSRRARSRRTRRSRPRWSRPRSTPAAAARTPPPRATCTAPRSSRRTPPQRARRLLAAAGDAIRCGEAERAHGLLDEAAALTDDPLTAADVERLRGHVEMRRGSPVAANERLVREAERVRPRDPRRAASMFLEASVAHLMTGDVAQLIATAERARALSAGAEPAVELLATALIGEGQIALGRDRAGRRRAARLRAVPDGGRPARDRRDRRHGRASRGCGSRTGSAPRACSPACSAPPATRARSPR